MRKLIFIIGLLFTLACNCQVPSIGGMMKPISIISGECSGLWDITGDTRDSVVLAEVGGGTRGVSFSPDGTNCYIGDNTGAKLVYQYSLSVAWDLSSLSYVASNTVRASNTFHDLFIKPDGNNLYYVESSGDYIHNYSLGTTWDITTTSASPVNSFYLRTYDSEPSGVYFTSDGANMFITGVVKDSVQHFTLSTAWDITTSTHSEGFYVGAQENHPDAVSFNDYGTKMYIVGITNNTIFEYDLGTAYDVSTSVYNGVSSNPFSSSTGGMYFKPDGCYCFIITYTLGEFFVLTLE